MVQKMAHGHPEPPPGLELPDGWRNCPPMGHNILPPHTKSGIIPCKVPLGPRFGPYVGDKAFTPSVMIQQLQRKGIEVGLVIDLTNSWRYYDPAELPEDVQHIKIQCRGRGETPEPEAVNQFCFEVLKFKTAQSQGYEPAKHIVVHCTHGFNRTGFMLVNWMVRYESMSVAKAVQTFASFRPPGIYKNDYIEKLYDYHHELRDIKQKAPQVPDWKEEKDAEPEPEHAELTLENIKEGELKHDDVIGEAITEEEEESMRSTFVELITGTEAHGGDSRFPGSQPVSLARSNLGMLNEQRYMVTWKADGTRYLLLICRWGCYFMDRAFKVRRMQLRFLMPDLANRHHLTILDGEMIVDEDLETGKLHRRFLAYDMLVLNGKREIFNAPFEARWQEIGRAVALPRKSERQRIEAALHAGKPIHTPCKTAYKYEQEELSVRQKGFWILPKARELLERFIPNLSHESDGLILQPAGTSYKIGTCDNLLKWKFPHLNSVDFMLRILPSGEKALALLEARRSRGGGPAHLPILPGAKIVIDEDEAQRLVDTVIECSWNAELQSWVYMRDRKDKETPNAYHVYEKVVKSIEDNLKDEDLLQAIDEALQNEIYAKDNAIDNKTSNGNAT